MQLSKMHGMGKVTDLRLPKNVHGKIKANKQWGVTDNRKFGDLIPKTLSQIV